MFSSSSPSPKLFDMEELSCGLESNLRITVSTEGTDKKNQLELDLRHLQLERMTKALRQLANFLEPTLTFLNCHFTDYYLRSYWDTLIPEKLRQDLESKTVDEVKRCMTDLTTGKWKSYPEALNFPSSSNSPHQTWDFSNTTSLEQLIVSVGKLKLSELNLCTSYNDFQNRRTVLKEEVPKLFVDLEFDAFMSSKKMHEVFKFSEFIACACAGINMCGGPGEENGSDSPNLGGSGDGDELESVRHVVDVGSGKGYLSSFLSMYYDLQVLAIDASATNTDGCEKRLVKLDKTWPQLVRRAKERQLTGTCVNMGKHWRKKLLKMGITEEEYRTSLRDQCQSGEGNLKSITEMITTKTDLQQLVDINFGVDSDNQQSKYGIIGLHTCGNLGANILKLFVHNERAHFLCVVPCCYNLVREDESLYPENVFYGSKFGNQADGESGDGKTAPSPDCAIGFPLSRALNDYSNGKPFVMGRNARMLSAYSLPRMIDGDSNLEMPPVLYYRGMLQVLFQQHGLLPSDYCDNIHASEDCDIRVGRMTKKCSTFREYVTYALKKINRETPANILTDGSIEEIEGRYASSEMLSKFHKYYLLRAMYASIVEDLILLDRMVYLLDQESIVGAGLVQLFNPALSPRSHAIVAIKKS